MESGNGCGASASLNCLLASTFIMQLLMGIIGITTPIYAAEMGASQLLLGIIGATGGLVYSFIPLIMGAASDKIRRRKTPILAAMLLYGTACFLYILADEPWALVPIKAVELFSAAMFWPSVEALLTELCGENVERNLRKFNLSWSSAAVIGPAVGGGLISLYGAIAPFLVSSVFSVAVAAAAAISIMEPSDAQGGYRRSRPEAGSTSGLVMMAVVSVILFSFILGIIFNLFPAHATILGIPAYEAGLALFINGFARFAMFSVAYKIEGEIGKAEMFFAGSAALILASAIAAVSRTTVMFSIAFAIYGLGAGILYAAAIALILRWAEHARGYGAGLFESLIGVGYLLGSLAGGTAAEYISLNAPYMLALLLSIIVTLYHLIELKRRVGK